MNKRIQELLVEAHRQTKGGIYNGHPSEWSEKFAELIVRECMKCSDPLVSHYINTHTEQEQALLLAAIADYSSEIKKHFGVEE